MNWSNLRSLILITALMLAAGCAQMPSVAELSQADIAARAKVDRDDFKKITSVYGMTVYFQELNLGSFYLAAQCKDGGIGFDASYLIFDKTRFTSEGWAFWRDATDSDGKRLHVDKLRQDVLDGGMTREVLGIDMDKVYLTAHLQSGIRLRIDGQNGQQELFIEPKYVAAFLDRVATVSVPGLSPNT